MASGFPFLHFCTGTASTARGQRLGRRHEVLSEPDDKRFNPL